MKYASFFSLLAILLTSGCSTHIAKVEYEGSGNKSAENRPVINQVIVSDKRGTDSNWLGAIRGGYGNVLKTLNTEESTDLIVDKIYTDALNKSGLLSDSSDAPYKLEVVITKFDCSYYFNREAHAHVEVALVEQRSLKAVFSKTYKSDKTESGVGAGIFGDVDTLRNLAETAMNETVDKMLNDPEFIASLSSKPLASDNGRLKQLEALHNDKLISDQEYDEKRKEIISEL